MPGTGHEPSHVPEWGRSPPWHGPGALREGRMQSDGRYLLGLMLAGLVVLVATPVALVAALLRKEVRL